MGITELTVAVLPWLIEMLCFLALVTCRPALSLRLPPAPGNQLLGICQRGR
jgi:C4-dicarboxylate transporter DctM subunit